MSMEGVWPADETGPQGAVRDTVPGMDVGGVQGVQERSAAGAGTTLHLPFRPQPAVDPIAGVRCVL